MLNYLKAENLKCKGTFAQKLVVIAPALMILLALISGRYFVENGYNWWYILILPGFITLLTALVNQYEEKKLKYRAVFALPVNLKRAWISKVSLIGVYMAVASLIHLAGILLGMTVYNTSSGVSTIQVIGATSILFITSLWQIPLCLFLSKKLGLMPTIFLNLCGGITLSILAVDKAWWWACPYACIFVFGEILDENDHRGVDYRCCLPRFSANLYQTANKRAWERCAAPQRSAKYGTC